MKLLFNALLCISLVVSNSVALEQSCSSYVSIESEWNGGETGKLHFPAPVSANQWQMTIAFSTTPSEFIVYEAENINCAGNECTFSNTGFNGDVDQGGNLDLSFLLRCSSNCGKDAFEGMVFNEIPVCGDAISTTTTTTVSTTEFTGSTTPHTTRPTSEWEGPCVEDRFGFAEAIDKSLLFYEAERSGDLPESEMRITWRGDSALNDKGQNGEDLTGGYYDAGDHVKFGLPMAQTMTVLAWGGIAFREGYERAEMFGYLQDAVKWGTDYFIKAHVSPNEFYGQVGDGNTDHAFWGRPEEMTMDRPAWKIDAENPGTELACETAAAMAAASILFKDTKPDYSKELLEHAAQLFEFGDKYRGMYHLSITNAADFYKSWNGYNDELVWGALWLYKATQDESYFTKAKEYYEEFGFRGENTVFSWDDKISGIKVLMAEASGEAEDLNALNTLCQTFMDTPKSPGGRTHFMQWGSNRYASNAAFICLLIADMTGEVSYQEYALGQMEYMLGSSGRSYVTGFGNNPPLQPHHRAASCPDSGKCDWDNFHTSAPNPQILYGSLVGGAQDAGSDYISDNRQIFVEMEVTTDFNAGFQSTLAGLLQRKCS